MLGTTEIVIIGLLVVFLFGAAKLPKLARALGEAKAQFTAATRAPVLDEAKPAPTATDAKKE